MFKNFVTKVKEAKELVREAEAVKTYVYSHTSDEETKVEMVGGLWDGCNFTRSMANENVEFAKRQYKNAFTF